MWMKMIGVIVFGVIALGFITDGVAAYKTYFAISRGMELALDSAIVHSYDEQSARGGLVQLDKDTLRQTAKEELARTLKLDNQLNGTFLKDSTLELDISYDDDRDPVLIMTFRSHFSFTFKGVSYPVQVAKKVPYYTDYI